MNREREGGEQHCIAVSPKVSQGEGVASDSIYVEYEQPVSASHCVCVHARVRTCVCVCVCVCVHACMCVRACMMYNTDQCHIHLNSFWFVCVCVGRKSNLRVLA